MLVTSGGRGDLESIRLKRFVELFRSMRIGFLTTLLVLALSGPGVPEDVDVVLPMTIGVFGRRRFGFDLGRGTCVFDSQPAVRSSQMHCFKSSAGMVVKPLDFVRLRSEGRWSRAMRGERGKQASVCAGNVATSCFSEVSRKVM